MNELEPFVESVGQLLAALGQVLYLFAGLLAAHWAIVAWAVYWLLLARWTILFAELRRGAWLALGLLYCLVVLVWSAFAEPGWQIGDYRFPAVAEVAIKSAGWAAVAFGCGVLQRAWGLEPVQIDIFRPPEGQPVVDAGHHH